MLEVDVARVATNRLDWEDDEDCNCVKAKTHHSQRIASLNLIRNQFRVATLNTPGPDDQALSVASFSVTVQYAKVKFETPR